MGRGKFTSPRLQSFIGSQLCIHNSHIHSWADLKDEEYFVIGAYESGIDAAYHLSRLGKKVCLLDGRDYETMTYDPSHVLSPYTSERLAQLSKLDHVSIKSGFRVKEVLQAPEGFQIIAENNQTLFSHRPPINCTGFDCNLGPAEELFAINEQGFPMVNKYDESIKCRNVFLSGPKLMHGEILLCFIYKFRSRFSAPCSIIGAELELDLSILTHYQQAGMHLTDFQCCEDQQCHC